MAQTRSFIAGRDDPAQAKALVRAIYTQGPDKSGLLHSPEQTLGLELRGYLARTFGERKRQGLAIGRLDGWARAICYVAARVDSDVTAATVSRHAAWIGLRIPDSILTPIIEEASAARAAGALRYDPLVIGEMIQLTAAERAEYGIRRLIDACDDDQRAKRLARARQEKCRRERGAKPRSESIAAMAREAGVSLSTMKRRVSQIRHAHQDSISGKKSARDEIGSFTGERDETGSPSGAENDACGGGNSIVDGGGDD